MNHNKHSVAINSFHSHFNCLLNVDKGVNFIQIHSKKLSTPRSTQQRMPYERVKANLAWASWFNLSLLKHINKYLKVQKKLNDVPLPSLHFFRCWIRESYCICALRQIQNVQSEACRVPGPMCGFVVHLSQGLPTLLKDGYPGLTISET